jgi:hypothetical protein
LGRLDTTRTDHLGEVPMLSSAVRGEGTQQLQALRQANRVRLARADLKRRVAAGTITAREVVLDCPWEAAGMAVGDLVRSQRRFGEARCRRVLISAGVPENKPIGELTARQREGLASVLAVRARTTAKASGARADALGAT